MRVRSLKLTKMPTDQNLMLGNPCFYPFARLHLDTPGCSARCGLVPLGGGGVALHKRYRVMYGGKVMKSLYTCIVNLVLVCGLLAFGFMFLVVWICCWISG